MPYWLFLLVNVCGIHDPSVVYENTCITLDELCEGPQRSNFPYVHACHLMMETEPAVETLGFIKK
jgi:hypothetical protein